MPAKKYKVTLETHERDSLHQLIATGKSAARKLTHARILLACEESDEERGASDTEVAAAVHVSRPTVERVRKTFVEEGLERALNAKRPRQTRPPAFDGEREAKLIAIACSEPRGRRRWTIRLLADRLVELEVFESVSPETVRQVLKKNELKPWLKECWCIPPTQSAEFVCAMEDVLSVYQHPVCEQRPLVCVDETSKQQVKETRLPLPGRAGDVAKYDYEYERNGVSNLFIVFAPLIGWRHVEVTDRHTGQDWAYLMRDIVDCHFPNAASVIVVMDNLNTHKPASLYKAFPAAEAKRILDRLEFHYTPKHGSWLNMAEIEFGILQRQCLNRRIPDQQTLREEVAAWEIQRNADAVEVDWRFTTEDARIKLKRLYPSIDG